MITTITFFYSISVILSLYAPEINRYSHLGLVPLDTRFFVILLMTFMYIPLFVTMCILSHLMNSKLPKTFMHSDYQTAFIAVMLFNLFVLIVAQKDLLPDANLVSRILYFLRSYIRIDVAFAFICIFNFPYYTTKRILFHSLSFLSLVTFGGSKEGLFRIAYALLIRHLSVEKISVSFKLIAAILLAIFLAPVIFAAATLARYNYSLDYDSLFSIISGSSELIDFNIFASILARLSALDEIIWTFDKGYLFEEYYTFNTFFKSVVNYILPFNPFDTNSLTAYSNLARNFTWDEMMTSYSSKELTFVGSAYNLAGSNIFLSFIVLIIFGFILSVLVKIFEGSKIVYIVFLGFFYIQRSLSLDDTVIVLFNYIVSAFVFLILVKVLDRLKFNFR